MVTVTDEYEYDVYTAFSEAFASEDDAYVSLSRWCLNQYQERGAAEPWDGESFRDQHPEVDDFTALARLWASEQTPRQIVEDYFTSSSETLNMETVVVAAVPEWKGMNEIENDSTDE